MPLGVPIIISSACTIERDGLRGETVWLPKLRRVFRPYPFPLQPPSPLDKTM